MFKKVLIALDGSEGSEHALPFALELAAIDRAELVLAHVGQLTAARGGSLTAADAKLHKDLKKRAKVMSAYGVETSFVTRSTIAEAPARGLADIADEIGADLIVVGTPGHAPLAGALLGSVSQRLLGVAKQPVFVVPQSASAVRQAGPAGSADVSSAPIASAQARI